MKEKTKNILKIYGIWCVVGFILSTIYALFTIRGSIYTWAEQISDIVTTYLLLICLPIGIALVFSPAILVLYFLFKKYKDTISRIFFVSLIIPFTNWIYFYIEYFCFNNDIPTYSMVLGAAVISWFLPLAFFIALFIPKSLLPYKKDAIITIVLTELFGIGMVVLSFMFLEPIESFIEHSRLKCYEPVIEKIENYKSQHGVYPDTINDNIKVYKEFKYEPQNSNIDFILKLENHWTKSYYYCNNAEYDHCHEGWHCSGKHTKIGKWIKADYSD